MTDFVPKYLSFENISRDDIIENHTAVFQRGLLASGNNDTAILLLNGTYIYIKKKVQNIPFRGDHIVFTKIVN